MTDSKYAASLIESCARVTVCFSKYCIALSLCPNRLAGFVLIILHDLWLRRVPRPDSSSHLSAICNPGDLTAWISKGVSTGLLNTGYMIHWLLPKGKSSLSLSLVLSLHHLTRIICADSPFQHNRNGWLWQTTTATCHTNKLYTSSNSFLITDEHKHTNTLSSVQIKECKCASRATSAVILYRKASWEFGGVSTVFYKGLWQSFQGKLREVC